MKILNDLALLMVALVLAVLTLIAPQIATVLVLSLIYMRVTEIARRPRL